MNHLNNFNNFIFETLKSDDIDIVEKKLDNFFQSSGFFKKTDFGSNVKLPYYNVHHDRKIIIKTIKELENPDQKTIDRYKELNIDISNSIEHYKKGLDGLRKGDIFIFTSPTKKITPQFIDDFLHLIESVGYFVATTGAFEKKLKDKTQIREYLLKKGRGGIPNGISISIEPNYDTQMEFDGQYLYHTAPKKVMDKIMKYGLNPKSKNTVSFYPQRIYLSPDEKTMDTILPQLKDKKVDEAYVKLRIRNFKGLKLYKDLRFSGGFYTYDCIHPKYIEKL